MGVGSGRSKAAELSFRVFGKAVHPDFFAVRAHRRVGQGAWEADVRVIEGGHAVVFRRGPLRVTEVLCGPETTLPEPGLIYQSQVRHERTTRLLPGFGLEYHACLEVERVDPEVFAHLSDEMAFDSGVGCLTHQFAPADRLSSPPVSHVRYEAKANRLTVHTFHTFPGELAVVRTQSLYEPH